MRIAHVSATFPPHYTGTGIVCYHNALGAARQGHPITVFSAKWPLEGHRDPPELTVVRLPALLRIGNAPLLPGLLALKDFDVIHLHHPFIFGAEAVWAASRLHGVPYVVTHHNDLIGPGLRRSLFATYSALSSRIVFGGARRIVVVSRDHALSCNLAPLFERRQDRVVEIPNGVDTQLFQPQLDGQPLRQRYGLAPSATVLLFVSPLDRAHHYRRLDLLMEAVRRLHRPALHLLVVGDGDQAAHYRALAERLGLGNRVHFLGKVAQTDLPSIYAAADIVVLPSHLQESFGLVLIEAMACGKPVIASSLPGVRAVVRDGEDGLLVRAGDVDELAEKICYLVDDRQLRCEMGWRGRAKVEAEYAWHRVIPRLMQLYEAALS